MLTIRYKDDGDKKLYTDIDKEFALIHFKNDKTVSKILMEIEQAHYNDEYTFIDRFGYKLSKDYLSTGCKAAIVIHTIGINRIKKEIDVTECGINAIDSIIRNCKDGKILAPFIGLPVGYDPYDMSIPEVDISLDGYRFTNLKSFNDWITSDYPGKPDMSLPGVSKLTN